MTYVKGSGPKKLIGFPDSVVRERRWKANKL
jgi:hypothetical protein